MSNFFLADRIKETSRTEGTSNIVLDGVVAGFSSFNDFYASGDVVFYAITDNKKYEVGSGVYKMDGSNRVVTRNPIRSSNMNSGPWYVSSDGDYYYPLWLSKSAAQSGVGFSDGPYSVVSGISFDAFPGQTFYYATEHAALGVANLAGSGANFNASGQPVTFIPGVKEVFVAYPGKTSVYNAYGISADIKEPQESGVAFWKNSQIINYSSKVTLDETNGRLGISKSNPGYALDVGGSRSESIVNASGYVEGGSGILFSGGQPTYTGSTASGGRQLEPFLRNQIGDGADGIIQLSGLVDQFIGFLAQTPGTVLAGPGVGYCGSGACDLDLPTFRLLSVEDLPLSDLIDEAFLRGPNASTFTGSGNSTVLISEDGNTISSGVGVICTYNVAESGVGKGIAVSLYDSGAGNHVWFKIPTSTKF